MKLPDVLVVGGGVIGLAVARRLALDGARTLVLERDLPGSHASWAAAGMLAPLAEADGPGPFLSLLLRSRALYPELAVALREESDVDVQYRDEGSLYLAFDASEQATLAARCRWQTEAGLPVERLSVDEVVLLEPAISRRVVGALRFGEDHQVDNRLLSRALAAAATRAGAEIRCGVEVREVVVAGARVVGVRTASGERIGAGAVVVAAGSWAGALGGLPRAVPVEPVHGQLLAVRTDPALLRHVVHSPRVYLVPRADGRVIVGATMERVGFEKAVTPAGVLSLLRPAIEAAPGLADAPLVEWWSGLRPGTPDGLPILGPDPRLPGVHYATGHFRNGILLAPLTAELVARSVQGSPPPEIAPFSIARFDPA